MRKFLLIVLVATVSSSAVNYSDEFAREFMFPLSAAAYSDEPERCLANRFTNATIYQKVTVSCRDLFDGNICSGFIAVLHDQEAIVLSFRGTTKASQLVSEAVKSVFLKWYAWFGMGNVSRYFGNAMNTLWYEHGLSQHLLELTKKYPNYEIWVSRGA
ncbi:hypothetical protein OESDEN_12387 [Oesophagostomum dentatum]|uniref:Fungal lipase-type domain-containing protein n=1 Tax=Oesophagostomum dentatum TaxID=61180 RepID=A0A0B1SXA9_OESDE|nr:hypothetical protein OESDEN_12387 [Oesophagostomum dentatum]